MKEKLLAIIPARGGSKRIPNKNIRNFFGKPLIAHTILQAKENSFIDRVVVDTDSQKIAAIARRCGAEVPFLRPKRLAADKASVNDSAVYFLKRLKKEEGYEPEYVMFLHTTSPLREQKDIHECWEFMKKSGATTVLTVCPTHPRLYYLGAKNKIILANSPGDKLPSNVQQWRKAYILNGCFVYIVKTSALLKEKDIFTSDTRAVVCDRWRSVDLDNPEDWVLAELLYKNRKKLGKQIKNFK
ncbi:MAG: acylneuraminate cytidylyltransferase family protein [Candidatus Giovannonibacteria bacterium]|nr:MAG: acylneuraminate cytidylyltransferase family protein [Candidatus Giovannonibacteria bacterium]